MPRSHVRFSLVLVLLTSLFLAACGGAPAATTEPTTASAPEAPAATIAPTEAAPAAEPTTAPEAEATTAPAEEVTAATEEATEAPAGAAAEPTPPPPTLTPAPNAVQLEYWEMDWGLTDALQLLVNEFNTQNPDIYVKLTQLSWGDYTQKLQGAIAAGSPPDISSGDSGLPFNFAAQGQALEIDDLYEQWKQDGRFDDMTEWAQNKWYYNGHYVGASWQIDYRAIFYRTDLFEEAGIEPPTTHDELLAAAIKLTDKSKEQYGICVPGKQGSYDTDQFYMTLVLQNGGGLADPEGNPTFDTPEHLAALKFEQQLVAEAGPPGTASYTFGETNQLYQQGQCAMTMQGGWFVGTLERENPEMYAVTGILPALKGQGPNAVQRIVGFYNPWMIYNQSKHPEEAKKFLDFMMQKENLQRVYASSGGAHGSIYKSLRNDPLYEARPMTQEAASQVEQFAVDYWYPNNAAAVGIGSMGTGIADIIVNPVLVGSRSPEDALKDAQTQLSPLFEKQQ
jgi:multiple sugar transport system substrate-binding protein